jgi:hypothetical protein
VGRFLRGWPSSEPTPAHLLVRSQPAPFASSGRCQVDPSASWTPPVSLTSSRAGNRYAPNPLPCPLPLKPIPFPLLRLRAAHRCNFGRSTALEPCPSTASLRAAAVPSGSITHRDVPSHHCTCVLPQRLGPKADRQTRDTTGRSCAS